MNHSQVQHNIHVEQRLSALDMKNAEDMVIIAVECLYEVKVYDFSVFNPINFQIITMCEFALSYFTESVPLYTWLIKMYSKLGMTSLVSNLIQRMPMSDNDTLGIQRLGSQRFSLYTNFGMQ